VFQDKAMLLLSTSPGAGGAANVLAAATQSAPYFGAHVKASISLPSFYDNFDIANGVLLNNEIKDELIEAVNLF